MNELKAALVLTMRFPYSVMALVWVMVPALTSDQLPPEKCQSAGLAARSKRRDWVAEGAAGWGAQAAGQSEATVVVGLPGTARPQRASTEAPPPPEPPAAGGKSADLTTAAP